MKNFIIITNRTKDKELQVTNRNRDYQTAHGAEYIVEDELPEEGSGYTEAGCVPENTECAIVLGGDGTMLQAAIDLIDTEIPLVGINLGTLGFLSEVNRNDLETSLDQLLSDHFEIEQRMMLSGSVYSGTKQKETFQALNDIVITRRGSLQINSYNIFVNEKHLHCYHADGILVATPTGSTGYNLSAGGPIVNPCARLMVLTPICPHSMQNRSIVFSAEDQIRIEVEERREPVPAGGIEVIFDGGHQITLKAGDRVEIVHSEKTTGIIKLHKESFLEILNKKLGES